MWIKSHFFVFVLPDELKMIPNLWYHVCFSFEGRSNKKALMVINDVVVLNETTHVKEFDVAKNDFNKSGIELGSITPTRPNFDSFGGILTDINIWSKPLTIEDMWTYTKTCSTSSMSLNPDILDWSFISIATNHSNITERPVNITGTCRKSSKERNQHCFRILISSQ